MKSLYSSDIFFSKFLFLLFFLSTFFLKLIYFNLILHLPVIQRNDILFIIFFTLFISIFPQFLFKLFLFAGDFFLSGILLANIGYFRYYKNFIPVELFGLLKFAPGIKSAIFDIIKTHEWLFILTPLAYIFFKIKRDSKIKTFKKKKIYILAIFSRVLACSILIIQFFAVYRLNLMRPRWPLYPT